MTTSIDKDTIRARLVPLVDKYLADHPDVLKQYGKVADSLPKAPAAPVKAPAAPAAPAKAEAKPETKAAEAAAPGKVDLAALLDDDLELDAVIPGLLAKSSDGDLGVTELVADLELDDAADEADEPDEDGPQLDGKKLKALLAGELSEDEEKQFADDDLVIVVEYRD